ncbi:Sporulation related domain protein [Shimia sp. SK013]|uniref:SPOR domain-containing protein n=1 Tax=Shimia sp. SK013 TaxID=1389006 RepID=UPI0006B464B0|nr:SPOR domain-containing protein [Shimia sp. SK013]KPA20841.1 Sporulation related domain protein [Shimia sp. SK013]
MADQSPQTGTRRLLKTGTAMLALGLLMSACAEGEGFNFGNGPDTTSNESSAPNSSNTTKLVERDVEAPEVFAVSEAGLWDGRPSLGGVWAAHPDVNSPERVIIRNQANGKFVIGALFRREREIPGPRIQVSSDAAEALGLLAGQPVELNMTALRREEVAPEPEMSETDGTAEVADVEEAPLEPIAAASAAIAAAEASTAPVAAPAPTPAAQSEVAPKPASSSLAKPYVQIGIFSVESNADNAAKQMKAAGLTPLIKKTTSGSKTFWRVIVGPATTKAGLKSMTKTVHGTGFTDAYAVTN